MTMPDDVPLDVLIAARKAALPQYDVDMKSYGMVLRGEADTWPIVKVAIRAIMAEREACAAIAEIIAGHKPAEATGRPWSSIQNSAMEIGIKTAGLIAAAIRDRGAA
jgi:hypothetical protein